MITVRHSSPSSAEQDKCGSLPHEQVRFHKLHFPQVLHLQCISSYCPWQKLSGRLDVENITVHWCKSFHSFLLSRCGRKQDQAARTSGGVGSSDRAEKGLGADNGAQVLEVHMCICLATCSTKTISGRWSGSGLMHILTRSRSCEEKVL